MSLLSHYKRLFALYNIAAYHRLDTHLPNTAQFAPLKRLIRLHPTSYGRKSTPLGVKYALEEMGVLFVKLGQLLSTRSDLLPPNIITQLALLQDSVTPFDGTTAKAIISDPTLGLGRSIDALFDHFDPTPLAAASIAQVHTARLHDGTQVVVKVVRPTIKANIIADFEILRQLAHFASARNEMARTIHLVQVVEDYRQIMLGELDLTQEAINAQTMKRHFEGSPLIYVPQVYHASPSVMISERIYGLPISQLDEFDRLGYDRRVLAEQGLTIFFKQVFDYNFFHADMHAGNIFVETLPNGGAVKHPRYIGLDCAIMGELSKSDQLMVARLLLAVMNGNFDELTHLIIQAGWTPPDADKHSLSKDMTRTVSPMINKPIDQIDFAHVLYAILEVARRHQMSIPPTLVLLLKTLVHVEGLGRGLYPQLDIWQLAKPILTKWLKAQLNPNKLLDDTKTALPQQLLGTLQLPHLALDSLQSLSMLGARQVVTVRELQLLRQDLLNNKRHDWIAAGGFLLCLAIGLDTHLAWLSLLCYAIGAMFIVWRITRT